MSDSADQTAAPAGVELFTFGEPTAVLDSRGILDYAECWQNGQYYEPPVSLSGLARTTRSNPILQSGLLFKRNMLAMTFRPHRLLTRERFNQLALDWITFGTGYVERRKSVTGRAIELQVPLAQYMRRGVTEGEFFQIRGFRDEHAFKAGSVFQLRNADVDQEIYGMPEWLSAVQSALLNESATLFRRRYYNNGSHAGFILYLSDSNVNKDDVDGMRAALRESKGVGNFKNLFLHSPGGSKDGIKLIPISEVAAKDEFSGIKNVTRDDMLTALRVPPQLLSIVPQNTGGFGDIGKTAGVWAAMELGPLQAGMTAINEWLGEDVITFSPFGLGLPS